MDAFGQILEMDDEEDDMEFSFSVTGSFLEAETFYPKIEDAINRGDFDEIYSHAYYLFGVASSMGAIKVRSTCEELKRLGKRQDLHGDRMDDELALQRAADVLVNAKVAYGQTADVFRKFYKIT
ncbi:hpt domain-containing protein [Fusarium avenaceum]|nr:hpt domain-containing protein [Fusarium avenaceum]